MTEEQRLAIHKEQTDDIYRSIGKFAVEFEQMVFKMGLTIKMIMVANGLNNAILADIVISDLTAYPMYNIYRSTILEVIKPEDKDKKIIFAIMNQIKSMIETRNNTIHGTWFVGWGEEGATDFSVASGHISKKSSNVVDIKSFEYTSGDFDKLSEECKHLSECIGLLMAVALYGHAIQNNFDLSPSNDVSILS